MHREIRAFSLFHGERERRAREPWERLWREIEEAAERLAAVTLTTEPASAAELAQAEANAARRIWLGNINRVRVALLDKLVAADGDWDRIDEICTTADWAPTDAIAMVLTRDRELAERMLLGWLARRGSAR